MQFPPQADNTFSSGFSNSEQDIFYWRSGIDCASVVIQATLAPCLDVEILPMRINIQ